MADANTVATLYPQLFQAVLADEWEDALTIATKLKAAHEAEQPFSAWSDWNQRNAR